jgi:DNA-binding response OmpR family regulator
MALQVQGYKTHAAYDGTAGLQCLYEVQPDLVLLDVMMPGHDGWEVCRRVREMTDVPIIMLTAKRELSHRLRGLNLGADDYVS